MSKSKRNISVASTASALALLALSGTALAQETADDTYDSQATDTQSQGMESSATNPAMGAKDDPQQIATTLGVSELNDIENWKVTSGGTELGEIDRLGVDRATGEILAVVALSGVVGANMKEVAVPLKNLTKAADETLSTDLSKDELQKERDIDPWDGSYSQVIKEDTTQ
jgi:hypothetical protein